MHTPTETIQNEVGIQKLYFFPNDYGASAVKNDWSYGRSEGKWELAVLKGTKEDFKLCYTTPITADVLGWLSDKEVEDLLTQIENLPASSEAAKAPTPSSAQYLGDSVYIQVNRNLLLLTTDSHELKNAGSQIWLEHSVAVALRDYLNGYLG